MRFPGQRKGSNTRPAASVGTEKPHSRLLRNRRLLLAGVAAFWLLLDQLTKAWAVNALADRDIHLFWTLRLNLVFNEGAVFGLGSSLAPYITWLVVIVSLLIVGSTWRNESRFVAVVAGLVLGGALGNLGDRAFRGDEGVFSGKVVDFIDLQWWPVFNVADSGITIGVLLFVFSSFFARKSEPGDQAAEPSERTAEQTAEPSKQAAKRTAEPSERTAEPGERTAEQAADRTAEQTAEPGKQAAIDANNVDEVAETKDEAADKSEEQKSNHLGTL